MKRKDMKFCRGPFSKTLQRKERKAWNEEKRAEFRSFFGLSLSLRTSMRWFLSKKRKLSRKIWKKPVFCPEFPRRRRFTRAMKANFLGGLKKSRRREKRKLGWNKSGKLRSSLFATRIGKCCNLLWEMREMLPGRPAGLLPDKGKKCCKNFPSNGEKPEKKAGWESWF